MKRDVSNLLRVIGADLAVRARSLGTNRMRKSRVILIFVSVLVVGSALAMFVSLNRHQTLDNYIRELEARGEKMTFEDLIASLSPSTNNSVAVLTEIVRQLGAAPGGATNVDLMHYVGPGCAQVAWKLSEASWAVPAGSTAHPSWVQVGEGITVARAQLAKLRETMKAPAPHAGARTNYFEPTTPFRVVKNAALWLASEAVWNLHNGRQADALAGVEALAGLANLHREEYSLVSQMTRVAVADVGLGLTWEALQAKEWSSPELLTLQRCWAGFDFLEALERAMEGERCLGREAMTRLKEQDPANEKRMSDSIYGKNFLEGDLLFQLKHVQGYVEQVRSLRVDRSWKEVSGALDQLNGQIDALTNSPARFRYLMTAVATPNFKKAVWKCVQTETERRVAITAIALQRYRQKHGQFPPGLDGLVPEFLASVTRDCMNAQPLRYRRQDKGSFVLYSVGADGRDNGGDPSPAKAQDKPGFWDGLDAVWPEERVQP